ncbi:MAG TPA: hypothetical protein VF960_05445, partial [Chloroflexota bacterium]
MLPLWRELRLAVPFHRLFPHFLGHRYPVLLDSSLIHPEMGRFSYIASDPVAVIRSKNGRVDVAGVEGAGTPRGDPFAVLSDLLARFPAETLPGIPPFQGGAVGYFGYDLAHHVENLPRTVVDDLDIPDMVVGVYDRVLSHEHASGRTWALAMPIGPHGRDGALARLDELACAAEDAADQGDS